MIISMRPTKPARHDLASTQTVRLSLPASERLGDDLFDVMSPDFQIRPVTTLQLHHKKIKLFPICVSTTPSMHFYITTFTDNAALYDFVFSTGGL